MEKRSQTYLDNYLSTLSDSERNRYHSFSEDYYCADKVNADLCAELVRIGQKTATCSLHICYEIEQEPLPTTKHLQVVLDWNKNPVCIIEIDSVTQCKFNEVQPEFAYAEGEGDRSLAWWRKSHWAFFANECKAFNIEPSEDMLLVLERFHVVHQ